MTKISRITRVDPRTGRRGGWTKCGVLRKVYRYEE
ncbi:hypothetical protein TOT_040000479 [Theileria orientalis strain Shintoku]|uniref:Uncharacterized protein n=1 Tax=Theileria orientalis strain Shintoku TaxID=869250 RepID=J4C986_THEOR|nr:hypothetical protein TOT_040000479 [Theileria orientalis strain Shintoku]BAM42103.1 hypothetical protein TOT_040000479 [Theileria orientalis strain Shintoku]|eukprot:XP_009692404.1 hypothetical protein TOT_040000479 [Theileria orientalis strain Shintoku]